MRVAVIALFLATSAFAGQPNPQIPQDKLPDCDVFDCNAYREEWHDLGQCAEWLGTPGQSGCKEWDGEADGTLEWLGIFPAKAGESTGCDATCPPCVKDCTVTLADGVTEVDSSCISLLDPKPEPACTGGDTTCKHCGYEIQLIMGVMLNLVAEEAP